MKSYNFPECMNNNPEFFFSKCLPLNLRFWDWFIFVGKQIIACLMYFGYCYSSVFAIIYVNTAVIEFIFSYIRIFVFLCILKKKVKLPSLPFIKLYPNKSKTSIYSENFEWKNNVYIKLTKSYLYVLYEWICHCYHVTFSILL